MYKKHLLAAGCTDAFAKRALLYTPLYAGDIEAFIASVEGILELPRTADELDFEPPIPMIAAAQLDAGNLQVELEYNGDNLTSFGIRP